MRVNRNFEKVDQQEAGPRRIGGADSDRYNRYFDLVEPHARGLVLDIGCGTGAFLARCRDHAEKLIGVDVSSTAVAAARTRFPDIDFFEGSADRLADIPELQPLKFDLIICSDVIHYLSDRGKHRLLEWISTHLSHDGRMFLAAWCPGGRYITVDEFVGLVGTHCVPTTTEVFKESGHVALLGRTRRRLPPSRSITKRGSRFPTARPSTGTRTSSNLPNGLPRSAKPATFP